jgi:hypothetical protein
MTVNTKLWLSEMWHYVVLCMCSNVSQECTASIFKVKNQTMYTYLSNHIMLYPRKLNFILNEVTASHLKRF